jgi:Asp-tRNA(Asn)/Glu-tRNA(Gln) amidotransferase B subunit
MVIEYLMSRFRSQKWKGVIGLEIHAQINTESKLFSGAEKNFGIALHISNYCV